MNVDPNMTHNPRNPYSGRGFRKLPSISRFFFPASIVFVIVGVGLTVKWSKEQRENPCIDCKRQKEIADEIYFGKPNKSNNSGCRIG